MLNKTMLIGRLGADPEVRYTQNGVPVANFNIATTERWKKDGEQQERTEWHRIIAWKGLAEICSQYLQKGKLVYIEGKLRSRTWEDNDGNRHRVTEVAAQTMQMLDRAGSNGSSGDSRNNEPPKYEGPGPGDDDIPF